MTTNKSDTELLPSSHSGEQKVTESEASMQTMLDAASTPLPSTPGSPNYEMKDSKDKSGLTIKSPLEGKPAKKSLIVMVHQMLSNANNETIEDFAKGEFSPVPNDSLRQIYDVEIATGRSSPNIISPSKEEEVVNELSSPHGWLAAFHVPKRQTPPRLMSKTQYESNSDKEVLPDDSTHKCADDDDKVKSSPTEDYENEGAIVNELPDSSWFPSFSTPDRLKSKKKSEVSAMASDPPGSNGNGGSPDPPEGHNLPESPPKLGIIRLHETPPGFSGIVKVPAKKDKGKKKKQNTGKHGFDESIVPERSGIGWFSSIFGGKKECLKTPEMPEGILASLSDEEQNTLPESPPGNRSFDKSSPSIFESEEDKELIEGVSSSKRSVKLAWFHFLILAIFLVAAIVGLSYGLTRFPDQEPLSIKEDEWVLGDHGSPNTSESPTEYLTGDTQPTHRPTPGPTAYTAEQHFLQLMSSVSPRTIVTLQNADTNQYRALQWLASDEDYFTYDNNKIMQRWVLALLSLELTRPTMEPSSRPSAAPSEAPTETPSAVHTNVPTESIFEVLATTETGTVPMQGGTSRFLNYNPLESWMQYTDECEWFTSWYRNTVACDSNGVYKRLALINTDLQGTLPPELTLLSKLGKFFVYTLSEYIIKMPQY
jgi:hypothetical protein